MSFYRNKIWEESWKCLDYECIPAVKWALARMLSGLTLRWSLQFKKKTRFIIWPNINKIFWKIIALWSPLILLFFRNLPCLDMSSQSETEETGVVSLISCHMAQLCRDTQHPRCALYINFALLPTWIRNVSIVATVAKIISFTNHLVSKRRGFSSHTRVSGHGRVNGR